MVFSVETIAIALNVAEFVAATEANTRLSGAGEAARTAGATALTEIAAITTYSMDVISSVSAMARGMFRCGFLASSTTLARSSKPTKAKNASRLANVIPERTPASSGGGSRSAAR
jgi:hypothetical protein